MSANGAMLVHYTTVVIIIDDGSLTLVYWDL